MYFFSTRHNTLQFSMQTKYGETPLSMAQDPSKTKALLQETDKVLALLLKLLFSQEVFLLDSSEHNRALRSLSI